MPSHRPHYQTQLIPADQVRIGMRVVALDRPWLETPFLLQGFEVTSQEELDQLCSLCQIVEVEVTATSATIPRPTRRKAERIRRQHSHQATHAARAEFPVAVTTYQDGLDAVRKLQASAAERKPLDLSSVRRTVSHCVRSVLRNPAPLQLLSKLRDRDHYTAEHSMNVAVLAIAFGRDLGFSDTDLHRLGTAALLHDIGKMQTPLEILNKPGKLDPAEAEIMRAHARVGYDLLKATPGVPRYVCDVAHYHHEAPDGSGYPEQLRGDALSDFVSIVTLCDVYDAITADRVYRSARSSIDALKVLHGLRGSKFHPDFTREFIRHIGPYPLGSIVELLSGEIAIVTTQTSLRHLPDVLIVLGADKQAVAPRPTQLLSAAASQSQKRLIRRVLPNGAFGIKLDQHMPTIASLLAALPQG